MFDSVSAAFGDSEISRLSVPADEVQPSAIGKVSYAQAKSLMFNSTKHFYEVGKIIENPLEKHRIMTFTILGKSEVFHAVNIVWKMLEPRTKQKWYKRFKFNCDCKGFEFHGNSDANFCQHILFVIMMFFESKNDL